MQTECVLQAVIHIHGYLLPRQEAEISLLQQRLILRVVNGLDDRYNFTLQIHQAANIAVNLCLKVYDFPQHPPL